MKTITRIPRIGGEQLLLARCFGIRLNKGPFKRVYSINPREASSNHIARTVEEAMELGFNVYSDGSMGGYMYFAPKKVDLTSAPIKIFLNKNKLDLIPAGVNPAECIGDMASGIDYSHPPVTRKNLKAFEKSHHHKFGRIAKAIKMGFIPYRTNSGKYVFHFQRSDFEHNSRVDRFIKSTKTLHPQFPTSPIL